MGNNSQGFKVTDPETGDTFKLDPEALVSSVRGVLLSRRRAQVQATVWSKLTEEQQQNEISAVTELAFNLVEKVVMVVAAQGQAVIHAKLDNYKSKDGEVTAVFKGKSDDEMVVALNHIGNKHVKISVADIDKFDQHRDFLAPEADQPSLEFSGPETGDAENEGDLYGRAVDLVVKDRKCSTSYIQRKLSIGYNKAARLVEEMEENGVVGAVNDVGKRDVLVPENVSAQTAETDDVEAMGAAMDADLDAMNDDDDLHAPAENTDPTPEPEPDQTPEPEQETEQEPETEAQADEQSEADPFADDEADESHIRGQKAFIRGDGPDDNPYDGGTEDYGIWSANYNHARDASKEIEAEGYEAARDGKTRRACDYEKGTAKAIFWEKGFVRGKDDAKTEKAAAPAPDPDASENDNFKLGWEAFAAGHSRDTNPHAPGMTKHRIWNEGFDKAKSELADAAQTA